MVVAVHGTERTRRERLAAIPWFGETFRTQVFFGFMLISLITAALGIYGWLGLNDAARTVTASYERPAAAVDAARAAQLAFARLDAERQRLASAAAAGAGRQELPLASLDGALKGVEKAALSPATAAAARAAEGAVSRWLDLPHSPLAGTVDWTAQTGAVEDRLDQLVALTLQESEREKTVATRWLANYALVNWAEVFGAVLTSLLLTSVMVRRITQPLSDAVALAVRITAGDLATPIPQTVKGEAGTLLRSMRVMQDSIRRMMDHEKLQRRSAQTRLVDALEGADEAVALVDEQNQLVLANSQVTSFFPAAAGKLQEGTSFLDLLSFVDQASVKASPDQGEAEPAGDLTPQTDGLQQFLRLAVGEVQLLDGRWLRVSHNPTRDGGFFVLWSDITAMKDREARLQAAKLEAEIANAAKSRFLSTVGHELRTPLNAIIGFSEIMEARAFGPLGSPTYQDFVTHILKGGRQLLDAINGILDLAKSDAGTLDISPDVVDLRRLLDECGRSVRDRCQQAGLDFTIDLPEELEIWGDPGRLKQTVNNLLSNAVKFTAAGGSVRIGACRRSDGSVEIRIADTGIGMRPEDIPFVLAPFNQIDGELDRNFDGTGLGLPLAKALIDLHKGTLVIDTAKGIGTTVIVSLPGGEAAGAAEAA